MIVNVIKVIRFIEKSLTKEDIEEILNKFKPVISSVEERINPSTTGVNIFKQSLKNFVFFIF